MSDAVNAAIVGRVSAYFARMERHLRRREQRESFATYAFGILGDGERKSVEPIAARASPDPEAANQAHDRLLHFIRDSPWSDRAVRLEAANYVIEALTERGDSVRAWIIDDTGFVKQGTQSPGVQRQYTGSLGKVGNCQVGVSLSIATPTEHVPIDFELFLPEAWIDDPERREKARIPPEARFMRKIDLAVEMIGRAVEDGIPGDVVLADTFYGRSHEFRDAVREFGLDYAVAVEASARVWVLDAQGRRRGDPTPVAELGLSIGRQGFRRITWRHGTRGKLSSSFCFRRVKAAYNGSTDPADREQEWLVMEWPDGEAKPTRFVLSTLPRRMTKKQIVRMIRERWRTERAYEELKGELGLDHFEGRTFTGWHHHVSVVLACYAFVVAERARSFSPSAARTSRTRPVALAA